MNFQLNEDQLTKLNEWQQEGKRKHGTFQGQYTYQFTPSKLGVMVVVECNVSNEKLYLTQYDAFQ